MIDTKETDRAPVCLVHDGHTEFEYISFVSVDY